MMAGGLVLLCLCVWSCFGLRGNLRERQINDTTLCDPSVKQYAGYFDIDNKTNKHYFYWAFESRSNPATDPTILWMTGGPGCSSMLALLAENGPCTIQTDATTKVNQYGWNAKANLVYIDQPAGVGFSYADEAGYDHGEAGVAEDMYNFLQALFAAHADWKKNDFFVTGESYGGHYVPAVAHRVWKGNNDGKEPKLPLTGIAIGNGLTDPEVQYGYYAQMGYNYSKQVLGKPVLSLQDYEQMTSAWPQCQKEITDCQSGQGCSQAQSDCNNDMIGPYQQTGMNPYDIREKCKVPPLCYDFSGADTYLNSAAVQKALGVSQGWEACNFQVYALFTNDWMKNFQQDIPDMLADGVRVLIYAGDVDFICNWIGNKAWTLALKWPGQSAFKSAADKDWKVDGKVAGVVRTAQNFTFLQVHNAGHMVPMNQPEAALSMVETFIAGKAFA